MIDELEHVDTNLIRFNLKKETNEFIEKISQAFDPTKKIHQENHTIAPPTPSTLTATSTGATRKPSTTATPAPNVANGSVRGGGDPTPVNTAASADVPKVTSKPKSTASSAGGGGTMMCTRKKLIIVVGLFLTAVAIVALVCGLVFGLRR